MLLWTIYVAGKNTTYVRRSSCKVPDAALKQKDVLYSWPSLDV